MSLADAKRQEARDAATESMGAAVATTKESLDFAAPEIVPLHLSRLARRCVQIGIDMTLRLKEIDAAEEVAREDSRP